MQCPIDGEQLVITDRQGVEIDYCPKCRGVWLDRGELDKLIERSSSIGNPEPRYKEDRRIEPRREDYRKDDYKSDGYSSGSHHHPHKKKKSFLSDIFDFDF